MRTSDWPGRVFWQWTAFAVAIVLMWFSWPFAFVQYYGLGFLLVGPLILAAGVALRPTRRAWGVALASLLVGILPLAGFIALAAT